MQSARYSFIFVLTVFTIFAIPPSTQGAPDYPKDTGAPKRAVPTSQPTSQASASIRIDNFAYEPEDLEITVGTVVTWQNVDDVPHTATSKDDPQTFDSGPLDTDDKFAFTFTKPGKYSYFCKVHPHMTGVVTVK